MPGLASLQGSVQLPVWWLQQQQPAALHHVAPAAETVAAPLLEHLGCCLPATPQGGGYAELQDPLIRMQTLIADPGPALSACGGNANKGEGLITTQHDEKQREK